MKVSRVTIYAILAVITTVYAFPASSNDQKRPPVRRSVTDCLTDKNVPFAISTSPNWTALQTPYNLRLQYTPAVITLPVTTQHVSDSVTCAAAANLKVQAKGGGHSYASYSSGGKDGSAIVDMENFNSISLDTATNVAKVGAGVRLGNMAIAIYEQGKRALPHGTCPGVGVGGHATHGGYGYSSRKWGVTLDHIVGLDVVLADGSQIHASNSENQDIFYAMRGAADSFGIVTSFYFATEEAPDSVLLFQAGLVQGLKDIDVISTAFEDLQNFVLTSPLLTPDITFGIYTDSGGSLSMTGWCMSCDLDHFNNTVFPAILGSFPVTTQAVTPQDWIIALQALADPAPLAEPLYGYDKHDTFYAKSVVAHEEKPLTPASIRSFWQFMIDNQGKGPFFSIINLYGAPGSAINQPSPLSTAYSDRSALWVFQNYGYTANSLPPWDPSITPLIDNLNLAITNPEPDGNFTAYINYVDPDLSPPDAAVLYYGAATYDRLLGIKRSVDPGSVFWNPQAVGNAPPE